MRISLMLLVLAFCSVSTATQTERNDRPAQISVSRKSESIDLSEAADQKRDQAIAEIMPILDKVSYDKKAELIFRLGELVWEKSKHIYAKEFQRFEADYQQWMDDGRKGSEPDLSSYTSQSKALKEKALAHYATVLEQFPNYQRIDEVLYVLAYSQYEAGEKVQAAKNHSDLIRQFQNSIYVADSYLALGEYYFENNDAVKAAKAYDKAFHLGLKKGRTSTYIYALYKHAWCQFNQHDFKDALVKLKRVVELSDEAAARQQNQGFQGKDAIQLRREALFDMVRTFASLGQVEEAYVYFKGAAGDKQAYDFMQKLGRAFQNQGMYQEEIATYQILLRLDPLSPWAPQYQASIVNAYAQLSDRSNIRKQAEVLANTCSKASSKNPSDEIFRNSCLTAEQTLRDLALKYHRFANKLKLQEDFELARDLYEIHLRGFDGNEEAYRLRFFWAEILWDMGEWEKAAEIYERVLLADAKGEFAKAAATNAVLTWERIVQAQERPRFINKRLVLPSDKVQKKSGDNTFAMEQIPQNPSPQPLPPDLKQLIKAYDQFAQFFSNQTPSSEELNEILQNTFKAAVLLQSYQHVDEAEQRFLSLIRKSPDSSKAIKAATLVLDSLDARKDWIHLKERAGEFRNRVELLKDKQFVETVAKFEEGALINIILDEHNKALTYSDSAEQIRALTSVAQRFEQFANEKSKSLFATKALYNAAMIYSKMNRVDSAILVSEQWLSQYEEQSRKDKEKEQMLKSILAVVADLYEKTMELDKAAKAYEAYATRFEDEHSADMLYNSASIRFALANYADAARLFTQYATKYAHERDAIEAQFFAGLSYEKANDMQHALQIYQNIAVTKAKEVRHFVEAEYRMAKLYLARNDEKTVKVCHDILRKIQPLGTDFSDYDAIAPAGAFCAFQILEKEWDQYKNISFNVPLIKIKKQISLKQKTMEDLGKKYIRVLDYHNAEWGVAALYRAAEVQLEYVRALREMPDPKGLGAEALEVFHSELENVVFPVEEDAILALQKAEQRALELGVYSVLLRKIQDRLAIFNLDSGKKTASMPFFISHRPIDGETIRFASEKAEEVEQIKQALKVNTNDLRALKRLALLHFEQGRSELSMWLINRLTRLHGEDPELLNLAGLICIRQNQFSHAKPFFERALHLDSNKVDAWLNLGALTLSFGDKKNAFNAYSKAAQIQDAPHAALQGLEMSRGEG